LFLIKLYVITLLQPKINAKLKFQIQIPIELLIIAVTTGLSYFLQWQSIYGVDIVGTIPTGYGMNANCAL